MAVINQHVKGPVFSPHLRGRYGANVRHAPKGLSRNSIMPHKRGLTNMGADAYYSRRLDLGLTIHTKIDVGHFRGGLVSGIGTNNNTNNADTLVRVLGRIPVIDEAKTKMYMVFMPPAVMLPSTREWKTASQIWSASTRSQHRTNFAIYTADHETRELFPRKYNGLVYTYSDHRTYTRDGIKVSLPTIDWSKIVGGNIKSRTEMAKWTVGVWREKK